MNMKGKNLKNKIIISVLVISIILSSVVVHNVVLKKEAKKPKASSVEVINFTYSSAAFDDDSKHLVNEGIYDSRYFANSSKEYNHGLAKMSLALALASGSTSESIINWGENYDYVIDTTIDDKDIDYKIHRNAYIVEVYKQLGFYNDEYVKYEVSLNDTSNTSAYSIAMKKITVNDKEYTLVCATPRSGVYGAEWASNFYLTNKDNKCGFQLAGEDFYEGIKDYINKHKLGKNTKVWINGYSRGAGVANIAAACMDKDIEKGVYEFGKEDVYAYMCATPMATLDSDYNAEIYNNIFNIVIESDLVATVAPSYWGFNRYGNVIKIPHMYTSASDLKKIEKGQSVKLDEKHVEIIKKVGYSYNQIRFENAINDGRDDMNNLFEGLSVGGEISNLIDVVAKLFGRDVKEFGKDWQGVFVEITPFLIEQSKKYDEASGQWVKYDTLAEYLSQEYGSEIFNEATEAGVFSQTEYNEKIELISSMVDKNVIDKNTFEFCQTIIDTYYGIRIMAVHNGIDAEVVKEITGRVVDSVGDLVKSLSPLTSAIYCKNNHFGEFYMAWMENYNPYTKTIIK